MDKDILPEVVRLSGSAERKNIHLGKRLKTQSSPKVLNEYFTVPVSIHTQPETPT